MGALTSRQNADVEETDVSANHAYRYPPKSGNYFGSHFIMGGERFDTPQPEAYLFGENADLNFLGSRPTVFPYPPPQTIEPTRTLKSLVNIRKESVRFTKIIDTTDAATKSTALHIGAADSKQPSTPTLPATAPVSAPAAYNIEFVYDADAKCAITVYYFCTEEVTSSGCSYVSREPSLTSETFHCSSGVNQLFSQTSHVFQPHQFADDDLYYHADRDVLPVVIHCVVEEGTDDPKQSHTTICVVDHHPDGSYVLRALKQKIFVDGLCYLLQEIYGIENKNIHKLSALDEDTDDNGSECVICMCDTRDTLILPCRHLCLCNSCADSLRYQANNCPICRAPFRALLQIKAVRKKGAMGGLSPCPPSTAASGGISPPHPHLHPQQPELPVPSGYIHVSLIEALNGPPPMRLCESKIDELATSAPEATHATQAAEILNRTKDVVSGTADNGGRTPEIHMAVLTSNDLAQSSATATGVAKAKTTQNASAAAAAAEPAKNTPRPAKTNPKQQLRDTLKIINEKMTVASASGDAGEPDEADSDTEKLSPLLDKRQHTSQASRISEKIAAQSTSTITGQLPVLGADTTTGAAIDESAQFDGDTTTNKSTECLTTSATSSVSTVLPATVKEVHRSLPDSPVSGNSTLSTRSSSDSYSSGSSTRQLLATGAGGGGGATSDANALMQKTLTDGGVGGNVSGGVGAGGGANATSVATAVHV